jgi:hypothetical protein
MQATALGYKSSQGVRLPDRAGENVNGDVKEYKLSPEELEQYRSGSKTNEVALKQRNLTRWSKDKPYEVCTDMNRNWYQDEITRFIKMWNAGDCITEVAAELKKEVDEVALLVIDQKRKGRIEDRPGGAYGRGSDEEV